MGRNQAGVGKRKVTYEVIFTNRARKDLKSIPQKDREDILSKIEWLAKNAATIKHEKMKGNPEHSLHAGQFRILYLIDHEMRCITIQFVGKHDEVYRRLMRR
ncbi:MAG: type II toxin-antitoxin system RelE/ParE family toxin [Armatimonadetes bacterium]|nr:type II toxin-antitoxin system RelE/ParE family toxin [Armatimonadota bacterium]